MGALPSSIEQSLRDAGFSGTEIQVLRYLLEEDTMTLREIAHKTGKSTGVLDQSLKKLIRKGIIRRHEINSNPKYILSSFTAIGEWMQRDMQEKKAELKRRVENFESFLATIESDKNRPEMQFFEGEEGITQAYTALLSSGAKEFLHYFPVFQSIEDDPFRDFRVQYFRERRSKGIFSRVISQDTPLGRRYQSRDPFEYRQTVLLAEEEYPFIVEKIIAGDIVACINLIEKKACFVHYPELAATERAHFEAIWKQQKSRPTDSVPDATGHVPVPVSTRTLSAVRDFFLSRKSIATFAGFAVIAAMLTVGLYMRTAAMNLQRMKDKVQSIATTASFQIDAKDLEQLQVEEDWKKPEWAKVVNQLKDIRQSNENILFVYVFRKSKIDTENLEFVVDSHSLNPYANIDDNIHNDVDPDGNEIIEPEGPDKLQWPGQDYPTPPPEAFLAFEKSTSNSSFYEDAWGKMISGYAPIRDKTGKTVAVIAVDMSYTTYLGFNAQSITPALYFLGIFLFFVFIRLLAFNRSLFSELWNIVRSVQFGWKLVTALIVLVVILTSIYFYLRANAIRAVGLRMQAIAATAAKDFSDLDLDSLRTAEDMKTETYQKAFRLLNDIRNRNPGIRYAYIYRLRSNEQKLEFIADADSNFFIPFVSQDANVDGKMDVADENVYPGLALDNALLTNAVKQAIKEGKTDYDVNTDQWGSWISGIAPIYDEKGVLIGVLGFDFDLEKVNIFSEH